MGDTIFVYKKLIPHGGISKRNSIRWTEAEERKRRRDLKKMDMLRRKILEPIAEPNTDGSSNIVSNTSSTTIGQSDINDTSVTLKKSNGTSIKEIKILLDRIINIPANGNGTKDETVVEKIFITNSCDESDLSEEEIDAITNGAESDASDEDIEEFCVSEIHMNDTTESKTTNVVFDVSDDDEATDDDARKQPSGILNQPELKVVLERLDIVPQKSCTNSDLMDEDDISDSDTDSMDEFTVSTNLPEPYVHFEKTDKPDEKSCEVPAAGRLNPYVRLERISMNGAKSLKIAKKTYGALPKAIVLVDKLPDSLLIKRGIPLIQSQIPWEMERRDGYRRMYCVLGLKLFLQKQNREKIFVRRVSELRDTVIPMIIMNQKKREKSHFKKLKRLQKLSPKTINY